jgi:hypothetical protein
MDRGDQFVFGIALQAQQLDLERPSTLLEAGFDAL